MTVPEAAMYENDFPSSRKYHIWMPWKVPRMKPIPVPHGVSQSPDNEFRLAVLVLDKAHSDAALFPG
jgi:hypothetical protein